ncbi:MAG: hypothetical protein H6696_20205, partial [Deferribacteres bacterium]|nr:hypothetical protein [Deferribacteres bacterium]
DIIYSVSLKTNTVIGPWESDAKLAVIKRNLSGELANILLYDGSYLKNITIDREFIVAEDSNLTVEVDFTEGVIIFPREFNGQIRLFGPSVQSVHVGELNVAFTKSGDYISINTDRVPPAPPSGIKIRME